jgi:hypothetical protein
MEKRLIVIIAGIFLMLLPFVNAGYIGISPAKHEIYFEPYLERVFTFNVFSSSTNRENEIYVKGDLAEYVELSRTSFVKETSLDAILRLPGHIEKPGKHRILIGARETSFQFNETGQGIGGLAAIQAPIYVIVPYPGKYAEVKFIIFDVNEGENVSFRLEVHNLGNEKIFFRPEITVKKGEQELQKKVLDYQTLESKEKYNVEDTIDSGNLTPGEYGAILNFDYGKKVTIEKDFRIGTLYVNITDYSNRFIAETTNKFYVQVENLWNSPLRKVYSEVTITDKGNIIKKFRLPFIDLKPWEKANLTGLFDFSDVKAGKYIANIKVFYENKTTIKLANITFEKPGFNQTWIIVIIVVIVLLVVIIFLIIKVKKLKKPKNEKTKKTRKKK